MGFMHHVVDKWDWMHMGLSFMPMYDLCAISIYKKHGIFCRFCLLLKLTKINVLCVTIMICVRGIMMFRSYHLYKHIQTIENLVLSLTSICLDHNQIAPHRPQPSSHQHHPFGCKGNKVLMFDTPISLQTHTKTDSPFSPEYILQWIQILWCLILPKVILSRRGRVVVIHSLLWWYIAYSRTLTETRHTS